MKQFSISSLLSTIIAVFILMLLLAPVIGGLSGCSGTISHPTLNAKATGIVNATASDLLTAAKTYQALGSPGLPTNYASLFNGFTSAASQLQAQVGQPANLDVVSTGTAAVDAALQSKLIPGKVVTQAQVDAVASAYEQIAPK